nr:unnamed protein product [Spirometra erinaceieuropaei]
MESVAGSSSNAWTDGHLLNSRRMQVSARLSTPTVHDLLFADECALDTTSIEDMQRSMDLFVSSCAHLGLTINEDKIMIMHKQPPDAKYNVPRIHVHSTELKTVDNFTYLGSLVSRYIRIDNEMAHWITKAS